MQPDQNIPAKARRKGKAIEQQSALPVIKDW